MEHAFKRARTLVKGLRAALQLVQYWNRVLANGWPNEFLRSADFVVLLLAKLGCKWLLLTLSRELRNSPKQSQNPISLNYDSQRFPLIRPAPFKVILAHGPRYKLKCNNAKPTSVKFVAHCLQVTDNRSSK